MLIPGGTFRLKYYVAVYADHQITILGSKSTKCTITRLKLVIDISRKYRENNQVL